MNHESEQERQHRMVAAHQTVDGLIDFCFHPDHEKPLVLVGQAGLTDKQGQQQEAREYRAIDAVRDTFNRKAKELLESGIQPIGYKVVLESWMTYVLNTDFRPWIMAIQADWEQLEPTLMDLEVRRALATEYTEILVRLNAANDLRSSIFTAMQPFLKRTSEPPTGGDVNGIIVN